MKSMIVLAILIALSACTETGWDGQPRQKGATSTPMALQPNSDFNERLAAIQHNLDAPQTPWQSGPGAVAPIEKSDLKPGVTKVALLVPLNGSQKELGNSMMVAAQMALQDRHATTIELLPRDSGETASSAADAAKQAVADGAKLVLGPVFADQVKAASSAAGGTPLIGFTTDTSAADGHTFVMGFLPAEQVLRDLQFARERGASDVVLIAPDSAYGREVTNAATGNGAALPVKVIVSQPSDTPASMTAKLKTEMTPKTAILFAFDGQTVRRLVSGLAATGLTPQTTLMMGTGLLDDPQLATARELEGVFFASAPTGMRAQFQTRYKSIAKKAPARLASLAYDATALAVVVANTSQGLSQPFPDNQIEDPNGFVGVDGIFRFQDNGLVQRGLAILTWRSGQLAEISAAPASF